LAGLFCGRSPPKLDPFVGEYLPKLAGENGGFLLRGGQGETK
jgi:hypothetical protein